MFFVAEAVFLFRDNNSKILEVQEDSKGDRLDFGNYHSALHSDKSYYGNLDNTESGQPEARMIYGGITSHHFLAAEKVNTFFYSLKKQNPKTVVIIGPNHYSVGKSDVLISRYPYKTPWGWLNPDRDVIEKLINAKIATNDEDPFSKEHSISALVGFVKYNLPDAKIVPIILKRNATQNKVNNLAEKLDIILPKDSVVVASVDFSHHLNVLTSKYHDEKSISAISSFDFERIFSSEIDSPGSVYALEKYLESKHAQSMSYENTNSSEFSKDPSQSDVTSYVFSKFYSGEHKENKNVSILNLGGINIEKNFKSNMFEKIAGLEGNFFRGTDLTIANFEEENIAKMGQNGFIGKYKIELLGQIINHNEYVSKEISGKKIAIFHANENDIVNNTIRFGELIKKAKSENNYLIFYIDWNEKIGSTDLDSEKKLARIVADDGADVIFGNRTGDFVSSEIYNGKVIFYSSDNVYDKKNTGIAIGVVFDDERTKFYLFPYGYQDGQLAFLSYEQSNLFCNEYLGNIQSEIPCFFEK
jgi:MEMO1 family protein